jgi:hypothetical protein
MIVKIRKLSILVLVVPWVTACSDFGFQQNKEATLAEAKVFATEEPDLAAEAEPAAIETSPAPESASLLIVHTPSADIDASNLELTQAEGGVDFDLLGESNAFEPVRIGWPTAADYAFLTLPDADGEVHGIDQMFGDHTVGPDGTRADNAYAALAKYDGASADGFFLLTEADGRIDANDPVFERLRLWKDVNLDGEVQPDELIRLPEAGIAFLDLSSQADVEDTDANGNAAALKSVVGLASGALGLSSDLSFVYQKNNAQGYEDANGN